MIEEILLIILFGLLQKNRKSGGICDPVVFGAGAAVAFDFFVDSDAGAAVPSF